MAELTKKLCLLLLGEGDFGLLVLLLEAERDVVAAVLDVSLPRLLEIELVLLQVHGEAFKLSIGAHVGLPDYVADLGRAA